MEFIVVDKLIFKNV